MRRNRHVSDADFTIREPVNKLVDLLPGIDFEIDSGIGMPAPEIEAKDLAGKPMKLSDYRGKVVILSFVDPSVAQQFIYPKYRAIVNEFRDKPFALINITSIQEEQVSKKLVEDKVITWPVWQEGPDGLISNEWNVTGIPTN